MGRGVANTGTIKLSEIKNAFTYGSSVRTDTYTTPGTGTSTAPSNAVWAKIELWGAGASGSGYSLLGRVEAGGGGGGYCSYIAPVVGGVTTINYIVGQGGAAVTGNVSGNAGGSSRANGWNSTTEIRDIFCYGGTAGPASTGESTGGIGSSPPLGVHIENSTSTDGSPNSGSTGGAGANGGAGGGIGTIGTAPGGGGGAANSTISTSGAGANGKVVITWYGPSTANTLRSYLRGGSYVSEGAVGYSGSIPSSGTLKIRDFVGVDKIGYNGNTLPTGSSNVYVNDDDVSAGGGSTSANACIILHNDGRANSTGWNDNQTWMQRIVSNCDSTICGYYDVQFIKTVGPTPRGNTVNTWHQLNSNIMWAITASTAGEGSAANSARGFLTYRRRSDNVVLVNVAMNLHATAFSYTEPCPTCCFTPDTPITMANYTIKPIGEVRVGDMILSRTGPKMVSDIIVREKREMHAIRFADGRVLNASEDHPLYVKGKGYASVRPTVEYKDLGVPEILQEGDFVVDQNGNENEIVSITDLYYPHEVYTFAETEFYANGMLVY